MKRLGLSTLVGLVALLAASIAAAADFEFAQPEAKEKPELHRAREAHRRRGRGRQFVKRRKHHMAALHHLRKTEEGKAEIERFRNALKELQEEKKALRQSIHEAIQGGAEPIEALEAHEEESKALMKDGILLRLEHRENMLGIAEDHADEAVAKMWEKLHKHFEQGKGRGRRPRPELRRPELRRPELRKPGFEEPGFEEELDEEFEE